MTGLRCHGPHPSFQVESRGALHLPFEVTMPRLSWSHCLALLNFLPFFLLSHRGGCSSHPMEQERVSARDTWVQPFPLDEHTAVHAKAHN